MAVPETPAVKSHLLAPPPPLQLERDEDCGKKKTYSSFDIESSRNDTPTSTSNASSSSSSSASLIRASTYIAESSLQLAESVSIRGSQLVQTMSRHLLPSERDSSLKAVVFCGICLENVDKGKCYSLTGIASRSPEFSENVHNDDNNEMPKDSNSNDPDTDESVSKKLFGEPDSSSAVQQGCGHYFCRECLRSYLRSQLVELRVSPPCPYFFESHRTIDDGSFTEGGSSVVSKACLGRACQADFYALFPVNTSLDDNVEEDKDVEMGRDCTKAPFRALETAEKPESAAEEPSASERTRLSSFSLSHGKTNRGQVQRSTTLEMRKSSKTKKCSRVRKQRLDKSHSNLIVSAAESRRNAQVLARYDKAKQLASDPHYRECPECGHLQLPEMRSKTSSQRPDIGYLLPLLSERNNKEKGPPCTSATSAADIAATAGGRAERSRFKGEKEVVSNAMTCERCGLKFCYEHSTQHSPEESCLNFIRRTAREEAASENFIIEKLKCKNCPKCRWPTEKNRGCNHMVCVKCQADWCWLCGEDISQNVTGKEPEFHYSPTNIFGCMGSQFSRGNGECLGLSRCTSPVWWAIFVVVGLATSTAYLGFLAALALLSGCCFACCCCNCFGRGLERGCTIACPCLPSEFFEQPRATEALQMLILVPPAIISLLVMTLLWMIVAIVWALVIAPLLLLIGSPIWTLLLLTGRLSWNDILAFWAFCGTYLANSMAVQLLLEGIDPDNVDNEIF